MVRISLLYTLICFCRQGLISDCACTMGEFRLCLATLAYLMVLPLQVYKQSRELLLQCATPDAVARLQCTQLGQQSDKLWETYFTVQEHSSLTAFLRNVLTTEERKSDKGILIQVCAVMRDQIIYRALQCSLPRRHLLCLASR